MTQADSVHSTPPISTSAKNPPDGPQRPQDSLYRRTDISPEDFFRVLGRIRRAARDEIERLISWLDSTIDCDEDAAVDDAPCDGDTDTEPSLGSFDRMSDQINAWRTTALCSADVDAELDKSDYEPSLGAPNASEYGGHMNWAAGGDEGDREETAVPTIARATNCSTGVKRCMRTTSHPLVGLTWKQPERGPMPGTTSHSYDLEEGAVPGR
jgi:hypothetical protein